MPPARPSTPPWPPVVAPGDVPRDADGQPFEVLQERPTPGLLRRFLTTHRHLAGLTLGGLVAYVRRPAGERRGGLLYALLWTLSLPARPWVRKELRRASFPVQLRRRLELLGPTYIKLGQVLSLRQDLLPRSVTEELENLLDRLPVVPFERFLELVEEDLGRPVESCFSFVDPRPIGSASIAQTHRAVTLEGDGVILKLVKPGIRELLARDAKLLKGLGRLLELFLARYRPRRVIEEFVDYTSKEVDLRREADNAETFAANFRDEPDIVFPRIYRKYSSRNVLTMEFLDGVQPISPKARELPEADKERVIDLGSAALVRMLYRDGFFHADLHPANLMVLPGPKAGFIDLGMVGRFDDALRRTMLYYYYCLVIGDEENAARYLASVAETDSRSDLHGFRRALTDIGRRWRHSANFEEFSLAQLILQSVNLGGQYRIYFPVELVLMVKALVTFEGVGNALKPGIDVVAVTRPHINAIFLHQFNPLRVVRESLRGAPELVDAMVKAPMLVTESLRVLEQMNRKPSENPLAGLRGTLFGGFCLVAGAILAAFDGPPAAYLVLFALGLLLPLLRIG